MLGLPDGEDQRATAGEFPKPPPLPSTLPELRRTEPEHRRRLDYVDAFLEDFEAMDGALRIVRRG